MLADPLTRPWKFACWQELKPRWIDLAWVDLIIMVNRKDGWKYQRPNITYTITIRSAET